MTRRADAEAGTTLIEVLVAVTLLAMLATVIATGTRLGGRTWIAAERQTAETDDMEALQGLLRRTIVRARPAFASADPSDATVMFSGEADAFSLVVPQPGTDDRGPWARERFYVAPYGTSRALFMSWQVDAPGSANDRQGPGSEVLLLDLVSAMRLGYFGPAGPGEPPAWLDRWTDRTRLPDLVRLVVERDSPRLRSWPELVVGTRVTANAGCIYDALSATCQRVP